MKSKVSWFKMKRTFEIVLKLFSLLLPFIIGGLIMGYNIWQTIYSALIIVAIIVLIMFLFGKFKKTIK